MDRQISSGSEAQVTRIFYSVSPSPIVIELVEEKKCLCSFINEIAYLYNYGMIIDSKQVNKKCILAIHRKMSICLTLIFLTWSVTHSWISSKLILAYPFLLPLFWFMTSFIWMYYCLSHLCGPSHPLLPEREGFPVSDQFLSCIKFLVCWKPLLWHTGTLHVRTSSHFSVTNSTTIND